MKIGDLVQWVYHPPASSDIPAVLDVGVVVHVYTPAVDPASTSIDVMWEDGVYTLVAGHVEVISEKGRI
jgi:hypothetical protein